MVLYIVVAVTRHGNTINGLYTLSRIKAETYADELRKKEDLIEVYVKMVYLYEKPDV